MQEALGTQARREVSPRRVLFLLSAAELLVMEVATTHLDLAALARSYLAPS